MQNGVYNPTSTLFGAFQILSPGIVPAKFTPLLRHEDFVGSYATSNRNFTPLEKELIPQLPDWYIIPPEVVSICKHTKLTTSTAQPMRNYMLRGDAGTGKTEGAKAIAAGLGLRIFFTPVPQTAKSLISWGRCCQIQGTVRIPPSLLIPRLKISKWTLRLLITS